MALKAPWLFNMFGTGIRGFAANNNNRDNAGPRFIGAVGVFAKTRQVSRTVFEANSELGRLVAAVVAVSNQNHRQR